MKKTITILALVAMLGSGTAVFAQTPTDLTEEELSLIQQKRNMEEKIKTEMKEKLGLTAEQQQKLEAHRNSHRDQIKEHFETMQRLRQELKNELEKAEVDKAKIYSVHAKMKELDNKVADHRLEGILELREILTPEQFRKFDEFKGPGRGRRGGGPKGSGHKGGFMGKPGGFKGGPRGMDMP